VCKTFCSLYARLSPAKGTAIVPDHARPTPDEAERQTLESEEQNRTSCHRTSVDQDYIRTVDRVKNFCWGVIELLMRG